MSDFLFELGCEELPSASVWLLADEMRRLFGDALGEARIKYGSMNCFASPRRLALVVTDLDAMQPASQQQRRGPALAAAFDAKGQATAALLGFAKSLGVAVSDLNRIKTEKGEWMVYEHRLPGQETKTLLPAILIQVLTNLPLAKPMRWGDGDDTFARPVHWMVALFDQEVLDVECFGVRAGRSSFGHRFHHPQAVEIISPAQYEEQLKQAFVLADFDLRRALIRDEANQLASKLQARALIPDDLLDEVTAIVEWPVVLLAQFEQRFLEVPHEALIAAMQGHQKCFPLEDEAGQLLPYFIVISNLDSRNKEMVIKGNEKVMRARLSDAAFFFDQDRRQTLASLIPATAMVLFQAKLGSLKDKAERIAAFMAHLSPILNISEVEVARVAQLCKCDLLTGMVSEFPELQGLMGSYYAAHDGESSRVSKAINEQYLPRFSGDILPQSSLGLALSLADRIDTLVGIFALGQKPSGVKDPFKCRRHALAVARLLIADPAMMKLSQLLQIAKANYGEVLPKTHSALEELKDFILDRLASYYQTQGIAAEWVAAVRTRQDEWLYDFDRRLLALKVFVNLPEAASLASACKRVSHLLQQTDNKAPQQINTSDFSEDAEHALYLQIEEVTQTVEPLYVSGDYTTLLKCLASLKQPIDAFFDEVMVMVEEKRLRDNRLALLARLNQLLQGVADIALL
jgi:glycyl-tRNA synthetase beta chain